jgi:hypothetical protein
MKRVKRVEDLNICIIGAQGIVGVGAKMRIRTGRAGRPSGRRKPRALAGRRLVAKVLVPVMEHRPMGCLLGTQDRRRGRDDRRSGSARSSFKSGVRDFHQALQSCERGRPLKKGSEGSFTVIRSIARQHCR